MHGANMKIANNILHPLARYEENSSSSIST